MRKQISAVVGDPGILNYPLHRKYYANTADLLADVASVCVMHSEIHTCDPIFLEALLTLHRKLIIELTIIHRPTGRTYSVDIKGEIIEPWPDQFFEHASNLRRQRRL